MSRKSTKICDMLGSEEQMEENNHLFRQRFLSATPMAIFMQSLSDQLLYALTYHDAESSKQVFQLLLELDLFG